MATKSKVTTTKTEKPTIITKKILTERIQLNLVSKKLALTKAQVEAVLTEYLEATKHSLIAGEEIRFPSYFSLKTAITKPRVAMNLQTKKKMTIPSKRVPKVKFATDLKAAIVNKK